MNTDNLEQADKLRKKITELIIKVEVWTKANDFDSISDQDILNFNYIKSFVITDLLKQLKESIDELVEL